MISLKNGRLFCCLTLLSFKPNAIQAKIDLEQHSTERHLNEEPITQLDLSSSEFKLIVLFAKHPGRVWTREQLIEKLWGDNFFGEERVIDTHIARLRKKIEPAGDKPRFVQTIVGVGYKFEDT